jgi:dUTP pyrophosphatase
MIPVKIRLLPGARVPEYQTTGAAGADIFAFLERDMVLHPGQTGLVPTGLFMEIPDGYEAQIRPRSGLALKNGITLLNTPGTIDADYRGEVKLIMTNFGSEDFTVTNHMRVAQMVFGSVYRGHFITMEKLGDTERSEGGFGHSGI